MLWACLQSGYNPASDLLSWWSTRGFLRDIFGTADTSNPYTEEVMPGDGLAPS